MRLADASSFVSLSYNRAVNDVGSLTLTLPETFPTQYIIAPDGRIEVWRKLDTGREYLDTETTWLIKKVTTDRDDSGRVTLAIDADTPLGILREPGRFVNYAAGTANASVTAAYDDAIKAVARTNIGSTAGASRDLSALISIAADLGLAPSGSKSFAWRDCLKVMQELANSSAQEGVYLAFDIAATTQSTFEFRTYIQQRGVDHRFPGGMNPVILSPEFGNIGACTLSTDWRQEVTFALAGGRGEGADRLTASDQDDVRIGLSPFGLREKFVNSTQYETTTGLAAEASAVVRQSRPRTLFRGKILDVPGTRYGVQWAWGDYVTVQAFGQSFDARIDAVEVKVERGKETITAWVRGDL